MAAEPQTPADRIRGPLAWMARHKVAGNLLMAVLIIGGLLSLPRIRQEVFPEFELDIITVAIAYPGASPSEVEQGVVLAVEESIRGIDDLKEVRATAQEGMAVVIVELEDNADVDRALADVKSAVDRIQSFPADAERPVVSLASSRREVISVAVYGEQDELSLRVLAEKVRDDLLDDPRISYAELAAVRPYEISIEISQDNLRRYGLTLDAMANRIRAASVELPAGAVETRSGEILLRTTERRNRGDEFADIALLTRPDGTQVLVRDVAVVRDGFSDTDQEATFEGRRAALVKVFRVGNETPIEVAEAVKEYIARVSQELPPTARLAYLGDSSELYRDRIDLLMRNAYLGLILVLLTLGIFLEIRLAFWVTMGIPISFIGTLLFMPGLDVSFNMLSLFAFIVVLGIVVDDAIVVGEEIFYNRQQGMGFLEASVAGVRSVAGPVTFSVLTTVAAFSPLLFVPGVTGKFFGVIPIIVITVLLLSLFESLFILPSHLAHTKPPATTGWRGRLHHFRGRFNDGFEYFVHDLYRPVFQRLAAMRYVTMAVAVALFFLTVGLVAGGRLQFTFMPRIDSDRIIVTVRMPFGTPVSETRAVQERILRGLDEVFASAGGREALSRGVFAQVGALGAGEFGPMQLGSGGGSHLAEVVAYLTPSDFREVQAGEIARRWRQAVGEIPGIETLTYRFSTGPAASAPIDFELSHPETDVLEAAAARLAAGLATYNGVKDVNDGFMPGKEQLDLRIRPEARSLAITEFEMARQVRNAFYGVEAVRQQRGRDEVRTYVRLPRADRVSEHDIERFLLRAPNGQEIPLLQAADVTRGRSYTEIVRVDGKRVVNVTADVEDGVANANEIVATAQEQILPDLLARYPNLTYAMGGQQQDQAETFSVLGGNFILAMVAVFALLAIPFGSYLQPLVVMTAIPFGFVGAVLGHLLLGYDLSVISMMGIVALSGIVVNDSLVLVHAVNGFRDEGMTTWQAVTAGVTRRFRPILLTSLTTFFGLMPMILETSVQARFLIPMAISLGFGVMFATGITLVIVPCLYLILEDVIGLRDALRRRMTGEPAPSE